MEASEFTANDVNFRI